jgi:DNA-binding IscR family transcriptional regulator
LSIDGPFFITSCAKGKTGCELGSSCTIKEPLARVNETIAGVLKSISIQDLAEHEPQAGREHGDQMQAVGGLVALTIE